MTRSHERNVVTYLRRAAERVPDRQALILGSGESISFGALWRRAWQISRGMKADGLGAGDRAIVMIPMSIELYVTLLGLLMIGAVAVFVDPWIGRRQIAAFAAFAEPSAYIGIAKSHLLRLLDSRLRKIRLALTTGGRFCRLPAPRSLREFAGPVETGEPHPAGPEDPALITFTSGSSGLPKGTNRTHGFLAAQHEALAEEFPYSDDDIDMPMFPVFALNNLALGITSIVPRMDFRNVAGVDPVAILRQMEEHGVTTSTASPPFFDRVVAHLESHHSAAPRLRRILSGGAPVSDTQIRSWRAGLPETEIQIVYGSTEAEPVAHIGAEERLEAESDIRPGSPGYCVGKPAGRVKTRVNRIPDDREAPGELREVQANEIGELLVTGDHVCKDYFRNAAAVRENKIAEPDGTVWHRMGDTGYFDGQGRFWLAGRVHSTIHRNDGPVHPQLVEQAAGGGDRRVRRAAAVGLPDPDLGERVVLVLESAAGKALEQEVRTRVEQAGLIVDEIVLMDQALPVDPRHNSKIDYGKLREMLLHGTERRG
jgi:acyl-CoA synthetase (AMP-forming)/AMP-acid ligase II